MKPREKVYLIDGVQVRVRTDEKGNFRGANVSLRRPGDPQEEKAARLATIAASWIAAAEAQADNRRQVQAQTTRARREAAAAHWSVEWLQAAHVTFPGLGARRLAEEARKLVQLNRPEIAPKKRAEITTYRAKALLRDLKACE